MLQRRKSAKAAPAAARQAPARRPSTPLSLAGLLVAVFLVATFLYNEDVAKPTAGAADRRVAGGGPAGGAAAARGRAADLRVLHEAAHHEVNARRHRDTAAAGEGSEPEEHHHEPAEEHEEEKETPPVVAQTEPVVDQPPAAAAASGNTSSSGEQAAAAAAVRPVPEGCDVYKGQWTYDAAGEQAPLYRESECEFLTEQVTCMRNGRRDDSYQRWRWQPADCDLPRFDARLLLERLRNKRLMFVGDSLNRNQWESMVCLVQSVVPYGQKTLVKFVNNGSLNVFTAHEYNATVEFYWAPFLVQSNSDDPQVHSVVDRVIAWRAIAKHAKHWKGVDYLIFNTYIWWLNTFDMKVLKGGGRHQQHQAPAGGDAGWSKYALVDRPVAYREVLKTWAKWVDRHIDPAKTTVFFMGMSPNHHMPWAWGNSGGIKCAMETQPIMNLTGRLEIGTDWRLHGVARGVLARHLRRVPVHFVDITALSELRKDAHTSVHTLRQGKLLTPDQQADPKTYADCIHWCLPGLPDTWNHFLYAQIISAKFPSSDH